MRRACIVSLLTATMKVTRERGKRNLRQFVLELLNCLRGTSYIFQALSPPYKGYIMFCMYFFFLFRPLFSSLYLSFVKVKKEVWSKIYIRKVAGCLRMKDRRNFLLSAFSKIASHTGGRGGGGIISNGVFFELKKKTRKTTDILREKLIFILPCPGKKEALKHNAKKEKNKSFSRNGGQKYLLFNF